MSPQTARLLALLATIALWASLLSGCRAELAHDLDEPEATRIVSALDERGIPAESSREGRGDQRAWVVTVPSAELSRARALLRERELLGHREQGLAEVFDRSGLLPTPTEEEARLTRALQGELVRTLESVAGVLSARVHISVAEGRRGLTTLEAPQGQPTASVLLRYRSQGPPLTEGQVRSLVAGAVEGLTPDRVNVLLISQPSRSEVEGCRLVSLGPMAVTPASLGPLRLWLGLTTGAAALLALIVVFLALRSRRFRRRLAVAEVALNGQRQPASAEARAPSTVEGRG